MLTNSKEISKANELISKKVNQVIGETAENLLDEEEEKRIPVKFVCECDRADCNKKISFPIKTYKKIRKHPNQFLVLKGHENFEIEKIVRSFDVFNIVEKFQ